MKYTFRFTRRTLSAVYCMHLYELDHRSDSEQEASDRLRSQLVDVLPHQPPGYVHKDIVIQVDNLIGDDGQLEFRNQRLRFTVSLNSPPHSWKIRRRQPNDS